MNEDSLRIIKDKNGKFLIEWDKQDPKWKFLNHLTSAQISAMVEEAIRQDLQKKNDI